jgi:hypothetical protein
MIIVVLTSSPPCRARLVVPHPLFVNHKPVTRPGRTLASMRRGWIAPLYLGISFSKFLSMVRRVKAIRATVSMKIALSEPLLALVNNYLKALRFALFWLKETTRS